MAQGEPCVGGGVPYHTGRMALHILLAGAAYEASYSSSIGFSNLGVLMDLSVLLEPELVVAIGVVLVVTMSSVGTTLSSVP